MSRVGAQVERPSTPTYAGLTHERPFRSRPGTLYPHVHGADFGAREGGFGRGPLPPCARGCPAWTGESCQPGASTPACAGLTSPPTPSPSCPPLYSRMRGADAPRPPVQLAGATSTPACAGLTTAVQRWSGFSRLYPRMHGADRAGDLVGDIVGASTPAYAGLTTSRTRGTTPTRLYPRIRGADGDDLLSAWSNAPLPPHARG